MGEELQFEQAEYGSATPACGMCANELGARYFTVVDKRVCERCQAVLLTPPPGTPGSRFLSALKWGSGAAVLGFALYYGVVRLTGFELGLIAIVVGYLVGMGVKKGSCGVGGAGYQTLAIALTYLSISGTYYMLLLDELAKTDVQLDAFGYLVMVPISMAVPFLAGFENVLGILIIGFGLYQAWKINQRHKLVLSGPFEIIAPVADEA